MFLFFCFFTAAKNHINNTGDNNVSICKYHRTSAGVTVKITNANTADCTLRTADDMNYGWGAFKRGAANSKRARERGEQKIEVPNTSQEKEKPTDSWEIQGWRALKYAKPPNSTFHQ